MKFLSSALSALSLTAFAAAGPAPQGSTAGTTVDVTYDTLYSYPDLSTLALTCGTGENGLYPKGYVVLGDLPNFPFVGASPTVEGWNSPNCVACYRLTYKDKSINIIAVDDAQDGFVLSQAALDELTNGQAVELGNITATYERAAQADCGFTS